MPYQSFEFSIDDALATSQAVYEVQFTQWGLRSTPPAPKAVNPGFQFPPPGARAIPASLAGIAIGPRSTVDRCWVTWDRQKIVSSAASMGGKLNIESRPRPLTVEAPLMFPQGTRQGILPSTADAPILNNDPATAMSMGLLYVFPKNAGDADNISGPSQFGTETTILPDVYVDALGVNQILGGTNPSLPFFLPPYLELYLYLQPTLSPPPMARAPLMINYQHTLAASATPSCIAQLPIFGRKHVRVQVRNLTQVCSYRVGVLRAICENNLAQQSPVFEATAGTAAAVPAGTSTSFNLDRPCADYLTIYADAGLVGPSQVKVTVAAYD